MGVVCIQITQLYTQMVTDFRRTENLRHNFFASAKALPLKQLFTALTA